ncbi:MAG TPA: T9SS type A sorting domain-containing protein [Ignavibacteriales bacterium]|nr:T9SS type A sorting domain-containing protein [Ignavibacteriales bacterium]
MKRFISVLMFAFSVIFSIQNASLFGNETPKVKVFFDMLNSYTSAAVYEVKNEAAPPPGDKVLWELKPSTYKGAIRYSYDGKDYWEWDYYGSSRYRVGTGDFYGGTITGEIARSFYQWMLPETDIPADAEITSVKLEFTLYQYPPTSNPQLVNLYKVTGLNLLSAENTWKSINSESGGILLTNTPISVSGSFLTVDITPNTPYFDTFVSELKKSLASYHSFTLGIISANESDQNKFIIIDVASQYSKLTITFNSPTRQLTARNQLGTEDTQYNQGEIAIDNVWQNSPFSISAKWSTTHMVEAPQKVEDNNKDDWKFTNWVGGPTSYSQSVKLMSNTTLTTNFTQLYKLTVKNNLEGIGEQEIMLNGGKVISGHTETDIVSGTQYNISAFEILTREDGEDYQFSIWSDGVTTAAHPPITINSTETLTAYYKHSKYSGTSTAFSNSSQRKIVRTPNGSLHLVYESMGKVWYEMSTDNGVSWRLMNGGKPLVSEDAKLPSIEAYDIDSRIFITFQKKLENGFPPDSYLIELMVYNVDGDSPQDILDAWQSAPYSYNANPVVAFDFNQYVSDRVAVAFQDNSSSAPGILYRLAGLNSTNLHYEWKNSAARINGTDENSVNPSIKSIYYSANISKYNTDQKFHIAFEQQGNGSSVNYSLLNINRSGAASVSAPVDISSDIFPTSTDENEKPLVTVVNGVPYISWLHYSDWTYLHEAALARSTSGSWDLFDTYGKEDDITSVHMNNVGQNDFVLAWNVDGYGNEFVRSTSMSTPYFTNTSGRDLQVANGSDFTNTRLISFMTDAVPYYFTTSNPMSTGTLAKVTLSKETDGQNTSKTLESRTGIIKINDASFRATLGEIKAGDSYVKFRDIENDFTTEKETFPYALESKEFNTSDKTVLSYTSEFTMNDSVKMSSIFPKDLESLTFSLELVDAKSNELLKRLSSRKFNSNSISMGKPQAFRLDLNGIGSRTVKLRISYDMKTKDSVKVEYKLLNYYKPEGKIKKGSYVDLSFSEVKPVTEYGLSQNYPNPFNPTTVINYQIPKASKVMLKVYDMLGKEVITLVNEYKEQGRYSVQFNASNLPSGTYIYEIRANDFVKSGKMMLLK